MKKILILVSLFTALFASAQTQDTLYVWKSGALVNIQSIKSVDMDSITFKRPPVNPNGINIAGPNVTDIDGNVYQSVTNCGLTFTKQNLNVSTYSDGTPIPQVTTSAWANLTTGAWCYYNNDPANGAVYGKLYNWYAAAGIYDAASLANPALRKKLAPTGWHLPSDSEWSNLINCLDPNADGGNNNNVAGGKMKATGTIQAGTGLWQDPNTQATNASGFAGLPGASRTYDGTFSLIGNYCIWWSSSDSNTTYAWNRDLDYASTATVRATYVKENGFSIRCLRDSNTTVVPIAPSDLTGSVVSPAQINLSWTDNSTNETGFKIDRKIGSGNWVTGYGIINNADTINFSDTSVSAGITYTYRVSSFNSVGESLTYSNEITVSTTATTSLPTLATNGASSIGCSTAISGGTITTDGGAAITTKGVCWSTNFNPTIALTTKTTDGTGIGAFTSNITGLVANTTYYVRAYATNSVGTAYGNQVSFTTLQNTTNIPGPNVTDVDGNVYASVTNCGLTFTKQNLNVSKYSDGTPIPQVTDPTAWVNLTTGAWCYYNNDPANEAVYGKLYNWYAAAGIYDAASLANPALRKNLAPTGWHVPSDGEWSSLINCLDPNANGGNNSSNSAGGKMKATGTLQAGTGLWVSPNTEATNESGFTGLPAGFRDSNGTILGISSTGNWWSLSESSTTKAWLRELNYSLGRAYRGDYTKKGGISVRCVRD